MRFGAARGAWRSCRAIASTAVNVASAALLAVTPPRPDLLLRTARICLKLRRPRRAYHALAAVNAIDVRQIADPDRTAEQITNIAAVLCARRLRAEAKDVLRSAIALAPRAAAPRSALILLLEEDLRAAGGNISLEQWAELENLLRKSVIESPHLAAPRLALAAWSGTRGSIPGSADGASEGRRTETAHGGRKSAAGGSGGRTVRRRSPPRTC